MNILDKIPFLKSDEPEVPTTEVEEAEARAERIKFHRLHVRNGPANFKQPTNGQVKRAKVRDLARETKKGRRKQVRAHLAKMREAATLRGQLQAAGVLPYFDDTRTATPDAAAASILWLVARFAPAPADGSGRVELTREVVVKSLTEGLNAWQRAVGLPPTPLSPAYVLPVTLEADAA